MAGVELIATYWQGSDTDIGVGVFHKGAGWSIGGKVEKKVSHGYGTKWRTGGKRDRFHYTTYRVRHARCGYTCVDPGPNNCYYKYQEYRATSHLGGNASGRARWYPVTPRKYCVKFYPAGHGSELRVTRSAAATFRAGIRLGPINLSTQSGYNRKNGLFADVNKRRYICGWTGPPARGPGLLIVGRP